MQAVVLPSDKQSAVPWFGNPERCAMSTSENTLEKDMTSYVERLRDGVALANIPTLLLLLMQFTGEERWMQKPYLPTRSKGVDDNDTGGLPDDIQEKIRDAAFSAIMRWKNGAAPAHQTPEGEYLGRMLAASEGGEVPDKYLGIMAARFKAFAAPEPRIIEDKVPEGFQVLIVGAGMSGVGAAIRFKEAGIPFTIIEKQSDTGGVWHSHHYPGCSVDTPSHLYSYTFDGGNWSRYFPAQHEIASYFTDAARKFGVYDQIRFSTEALEARYDEASHEWVTTLKNPDGSTEVLRTNALITAVGTFAEPITPKIPGLDKFKGKVVHTANWDHSLALKDKRVAVIGTGASAMQLVPAIVDEVEHLTIFQRTRQWAAPFPKFKKPVPEPVRFLMKEVPQYLYWYRLRLSWIFDSKVYPTLQKDPAWPDQENSINKANAGHRRFFERYIREELGDHQEFADKVIPNYPPYGKRMLLDNGWFRTVTRDDVTLVDNQEDGIDHITENAIHTRSGEVHEVDVIVTATGYNVQRMLSTMSIYGRNGVSIREAWDDTDPRAYLGTVVPEFPNMFTLYGPNTQLGHGGAFIFIMESQTDYVIKILDLMFDDDVAEVECRQDVYDRYNDAIQERHQNMIWTHTGMTTYVRNDKGRVTVNNPWELVEFWDLLQKADLSDYSVKKYAVASTL